MINKNKREFVINTSTKKYQLRFNIEKSNSGEEDFVILLDELQENRNHKPIIRLEESKHPKEHSLHKQFHIHYCEKEETKNIGKELSQKEKIEKGIEYLKKFVDKNLPFEEAQLFKSQIVGFQQQINRESVSPKYGKRTTTMPFTIDAILEYEKKNFKENNNE